MQFKLKNNQEISLEILRKPRLKNINLRITPKGVLVSANRRTPLADIEAFVLSKSDWLSKHLKNQEAQEKKRLFVTGNKVYFKGEVFVLECVEEQRYDVTLELCKNKFLIQMPKNTTQVTLQELFNDFYKKEAIMYITPLLEDWVKEMELYPKGLAFRKTTRQWGSCSSQNSLSFSYYLMKLPVNIIEYVVVHELAHIEEKNHSKNFWALVEEFLPNYKAVVKELREFERVL